MTATKLLTIKDVAGQLGIPIEEHVMFVARAVDPIVR